MADVLHHASDDQLALGICFAAVAVCGIIMHFSHYVGRLAGRTQSLSASARAQTLYAMQSRQPAQDECREKAA